MLFQRWLPFLSFSFHIYTEYLFSFTAYSDYFECQQVKLMVWNYVHEIVYLYIEKYYEEWYQMSRPLFNIKSFSRSHFYKRKPYIICKLIVNPIAWFSMWVELIWCDKYIHILLYDNYSNFEINVQLAMAELVALYIREGKNK